MLSTKIKEKIDSYLDAFNKNFYVKGDAFEKGVGVPIEYVTYKNGEPQFGYSGDGTINLSQMMQATYAKYLLSKGTINEDDVIESLFQQLAVLNRLELSARDACVNDNQYDVVKGFFIRDDISYSQKDNMGLKDVMTAYSQVVEGINVDVCQSPFVSQDQIWNLIPILKKISDLKIDKYDLSEIATLSASRMLKYVIDNNHVIYNPYYSHLLHDWTYCKLGINFSDRLEDRENNFKNSVKVKRGAYNWYFAYGFRKSYEVFSGMRLNKLTNFMYAMIYMPLILVADTLYHGIICKWLNLPVKQNSYYSLAYVSGVWYSQLFKKRLNKKFIESLYNSVENGKVVNELFMPHLFFLANDDFANKDFKYRAEVINGLTKYLEALPEFTGNGMLYNQSINIALSMYLDLMNS